MFKLVKLSTHIGLNLQQVIIDVLIFNSILYYTVWVDKRHIEFTTGSMYLYKYQLEMSSNIVAKRLLWPQANVPNKLLTELIVHQIAV